MVVGMFLGDAISQIRWIGGDDLADILESRFAGHLGDIVEVEDTGLGMVIHGVDSALVRGLVEARGPRAIYLE